MRSVLVLTVICILAGCVKTSQRDPSASSGSQHIASDVIERLAAKLSADSLWQNGISPHLDLPADASVEQVVERVFKMTGFNNGRVSNYRILNFRQVRISGTLPDIYTAVLVDTNLGRKIVLMQYAHSDWWTRVYDVQSI